MNWDLQKFGENLQAFIEGPEGQRLIDTGAGLIEREGDENYIRAVLTAEALGAALDANPIIVELETGQFQITWEGEELVKAQQFAETATIDALTANGEPSPVIVDFYPVIEPMTKKYAVPAVVGTLAVSGILGFMIGRGSR